MTQPPLTDWDTFVQEGRKLTKQAKTESAFRPNGQQAPPREPAIPYTIAATLKGKQQPREFIDFANVFPIRNVALLSGDGSVGKSLLAMQLALACTTGGQWIGIDVNPGPVVYFAAEDDRDEITNRVNEICDAEGFDLGEAHNLALLFMAGEHTVLAAEQNGQLKITRLFRMLCSTLEDHSPALLILDNLADVFSGNENNRSLAKQFITMLRWLCLRYDTTILLIGHPSLSGMQSGTGMSGSTAWNNSVRVRLYLKRPDGKDADDKERILEVMKANYAPGRTRFEIKWSTGRFVRGAAATAFSRIATDDVDRVRAKLSNEHWRVSPQSNDWAGHAVGELLGWDTGRFIKKADWSAEQERNRADISQYLSSWVTNKALFVVPGKTAKREQTHFYSTKPEVPDPLMKNDV